MSRYELKNAADKVEGYFIRTGGEGADRAFHRAKLEAAKALRSAADNIDLLTEEQFFELWPSLGRGDHL